MKEYEVVIRLLLSVLVGGFIGYERQHKNRPAGLRTHVLVCLGATIASMIQQYSFYDAINIVKGNSQLAQVIKVDMGRLAAQVITGVGFLGAGTIIHEKGSIRGLTTAASIWVVACIGLAVGYGYYFLSITSAILVFLVLVIFKKFEKKFMESEDAIEVNKEEKNGGQ